MNESTTTSLIILGALLIVLGIMRLWRVSLSALVFGFTGAVIGLLLGALASVPLNNLPGIYGTIVPIAVSLLFTITAVAILLSRRALIVEHLPFLGFASKKPQKASSGRDIFVDTSAIIDGRIADIARTGFVPGRLLVPRFVLAELQNIADSDDAMRRGRGRRGLEVLNMLRDMDGVVIEVVDEDPSAIKEVDAKLVSLSKDRGAHVLTTDFNLNRVAQIQGVRVLNVNELAGAIRPVVLPGEELAVRVVQPGKERGQGVGYLADGTMIVVENGESVIGQEVTTEVTRVFQTVAGKMIFATIKKNGNHEVAAKNAEALSAPLVPSEVSQVAATAEATGNAQPEKGFGRRGKNPTQGKKARGNRNNSTSRKPEDRLMDILDERSQSS